MRRFIPLALTAMLAYAAAANAASDPRTVPAFTGVSNSGPLDVTVTVGQAQSVVVSGDDKYVPEVRTEVVNGELQVSMKSHTFSNIHDLRVTIAVPQLTRYTMSGAGSTTLAHLAGDALTIDCSGAGSLKADGQVKSLKLDVSGVGSIDTRALSAQSANVSVSGVGSVKLTATDTLVADVSGVGSLTYYGHPKNVKKSASGVGSVHAGD